MRSSSKVSKNEASVGQLQGFVTATLQVFWTIYRAYFSGMIAYVVPVHTRDAAFQLFCDLRANTPKDQRFVVRHMRAFTPKTGPGWLALSCALGYAFTAMMGLMCITLGLSMAGILLGVTVALVGGVLLSLLLAGVAATLLVTACCSGTFAGMAFLGYAGLSTALAVVRFGYHLLTPSPQHVNNPQLDTADAEGSWLPAIPEESSADMAAAAEGVCSEADALRALPAGTQRSASAAAPEADKGEGAEGSAQRAGGGGEGGNSAAGGHGVPQEDVVGASPAQEGSSAAGGQFAAGGKKREVDPQEERTGSIAQEECTASTAQEERTGSTAQDECTASTTQEVPQAADGGLEGGSADGEAGGDISMSSHAVTTPLPVCRPTVPAGDGQAGRRAQGVVS